MATLDDSEVAVANILIEEKKYKEAFDLAQKAVETDPKDAEAYLVKGIAAFHLDKYQEAKEAFIQSQKLNSTKDSIKTWLQKCDTKLDMAKKIEPPALPSGPKTRYDWYQTDTHVVLTILLKKVKEEDCTIQIQPRSFSATIKLPTGSEYSLELDLAHPIDDKNSSYKVLSTKIEVKLKKVDGVRWTKLEGEPETNVKQFTPENTTTATAPKYPSASKKDWDRIAAEVEDDKAEGDAALNELFQKIYADGNEETKKAMQKSFYESGGTVLSTNWNEVGKDKVDVKPPDGMEYKKWDS